jgi:FeS assembly SUF system protein
MTDKKKLEKEIIETLKEVYDPEIPISVYDLGLIYNINISDEGKVKILMTLTTPTCPTGDYIKQMVKESVENIVGVGNVDVELTFDPPWNPDKVSPEIKEELGLINTSSFYSDSSINNLFNENNNEIELKTCFNCAKTDNEVPLLRCYYKGDKLYLCTKCLKKFE